VRQGRVLYDNLRKGVRYYLAVKVALVLSTLIAVLLRVPLPFNPLQIILLELFMDLGAAATFAADAPEEDVMARRPRDPKASFFDRSLLTGLFAGAASLLVTVLVPYLWAVSQGYDQSTAQTVAFAAWLIGHIILAVHMRSEREPLLRRGLVGQSGLFGNTTMLLWGAAALGFLALALAFGPLRGLLELSPIPTEAWRWILLTPLLATLPVELVKLATWRKPALKVAF
jgi:P-type Ca2+ transporter type 2C